MHMYLEASLHKAHTIIDLLNSLHFLSFLICFCDRLTRTEYCPLLTSFPNSLIFHFPLNILRYLPFIRTLTQQTLIIRALYRIMKRLTLPF